MVKKKKITMNDKMASFNLWNKPWINGSYSIRSILVRACDVREIVDKNPVAEAGLFRFLLAIVQDMIQPQNITDIIALLNAGCFPPKAIDAFEQEYAHRFDLFSPTEPFMQSGDISINPSPREKFSYVPRLTIEQPSGTFIAWHKHLPEEKAIYCPSCLAVSLVTIPAFATSAGMGYTPGINRTPPAYIFPKGRNLFESLVICLMTPEFQPSMCSVEDVPWWRHDPVVAPKGMWKQVGYTQGLTFMPRQIRLFPEFFSAPCTRCGNHVEVGVRRIYYGWGEGIFKERDNKGRVKNLVWQDPFVAYRGINAVLPPSRPDWVAWTSFPSIIFDDDKQQRPRSIAQLEKLGHPFSLWLVGMQSNNAKIHGWQDVNLAVNPGFFQRQDEIRETLLLMNIAVKILHKTGVTRRQVEHTLEVPFRNYLQTLDARDWRNAIRELPALIAQTGWNVDHSEVVRKINKSTG